MKQESDPGAASKQFSAALQDEKTPKQELKTPAARQKSPEYALLEDSARLNSIPKKVIMSKHPCLQVNSSWPTRMLPAIEV